MIDLVRLFASSLFRVLLFLPFRSLLLVQQGSEDRELSDPTYSEMTRLPRRIFR